MIKTRAGPDTLFDTQSAGNRRRASLVATLALILLQACALDSATDHKASRIAPILRETPLIDGHNDWLFALREREGEERWTMDLRSGFDKTPMPYNTDIARLRQGMVGGQFWSVYVPATLPGAQQVKETLEQIDLLKMIVRRYPETFAIARTADDVRRIHSSGRIASLIGVEGGGQIDESLSVLRAYHALGAGYLTLTHSKTISWADSATDDAQHGGLTPFGERVVRELNRLGMLVDLSHVSDETMRDALRVSRAPVIFSHSSARAIADHPRNVPDDILRLVAEKDGVVMVNFALPYVSDAYRIWLGKAAAERKRIQTSSAPDVAAAITARAYAEWEKSNPPPKVTISDVANHIDYIAVVAGVDHVGLGADFDGVNNMLPEGLAGVEDYPALLAELKRRGWSDKNLAKLAGGNILRVMSRAEAVAQEISFEASDNH